MKFVRGREDEGAPETAREKGKNDRRGRSKGVTDKGPRAVEGRGRE